MTIWKQSLDLHQANAMMVNTIGDTLGIVITEIINANHIRSVRSGLVTGVARPVHVGRRTQVWEIRIADDADKTVCVSRLTMAVIEAP